MENSFPKMVIKSKNGNSLTNYDLSFSSFYHSLPTMSFDFFLTIFSPCPNDKN